MRLVSQSWKDSDTWPEPSPIPWFTLLLVVANLGVLYYFFAWWLLCVLVPLTIVCLYLEDLEYQREARNFRAHQAWVSYLLEDKEDRWFRNIRQVSRH